MLIIDWPERRRTRLKRSTPTRRVCTSAAGAPTLVFTLLGACAAIACGAAAISVAPAAKASGVCVVMLPSRIQPTQSSRRCKHSTASAGGASSPCRWATICCITPTACCMSRTAAGLTASPACTRSSAHSITSSRRCAVRPIPGRPMMFPEPLNVCAMRCASIMCSVFAEPAAKLSRCASNRSSCSGASASMADNKPRSTSSIAKLTSSGVAGSNSAVAAANSSAANAGGISNMSRSRSSTDSSGATGHARR